MDISCSFSRDLFQAGGVVTALVKGYPPRSRDGRRSALFSGTASAPVCITAQCCGMAHVDSRWMKSGSQSTLFSQSSVFPLESAVTIPKVVFANNATCIFVTTREAISVDDFVIACSDTPKTTTNSSLLEESPVSEDVRGVFLQFDLPHDVLPSFKGLAVNVTYCLVISVTLPGDATVRTSLFHFQVVGAGCANRLEPGSTLAAPYQTRVVSLSVIPRVALPSDACLISMENFITDNVDDQEEAEIGINNVYNIRDRGLICSMELHSLAPSVVTLHPGGTLDVTLYFENGEQPCNAVRGKIVQSERRLDGSRVQVFDMCRLAIFARIVYFLGRRRVPYIITQIYIYIYIYNCMFFFRIKQSYP
jgi:hypothetical protein